MMTAHGACPASRSCSETTFAACLIQHMSAVRSDAVVTDFGVMQLAVYHHPWVWFLAWAVTFVCVVTLAYNERARRSYPTNWITLVIFTVGLQAIKCANTCACILARPDTLSDACCL